MVFIGNCCICGEKGNEIMIFPNGKLSSCDKDECDVKYTDMAIHHMIDYGEYCNFSYNGITNNIYIPRSSGKLSIGDIKKREIYGDYLFMVNGNIRIIVKFMDGNNEFHKLVDNNILANHNLHLPLINILPSYEKYNNKRLIAKQKEIFTYCLFTNKATRLIIYSALSRTLSYNNDIDGLFGILPNELICQIIKYYYE